MKTRLLQKSSQKKLEDNLTFTLMTTMYDEDNCSRRKEFAHCLERNLAHPLIEQIIVFYEKPNESSNELYTYISRKTDCIELVPVQKRPTFKMFFDFASKKLQSHNVILSNADIYFDKSLQKIRKSDLANNFFVLTRWNLAEDNILYLQTRKNPMYPWKRIRMNLMIDDASLQHSHSADAWVFVSPIETDFECNYEIGTYMSDSLLNHGLLQKQKEGTFSVFNPCLSIRACHLDRNVKGKSRRDYLEFAEAYYSAQDVAKAKAGFIEWCRLDSMRLQRRT